jgi:hypothetical protein
MNLVGRSSPRNDRNLRENDVIIANSDVELRGV